MRSACRTSASGGPARWAPSCATGLHDYRQHLRQDAGGLRDARSAPGRSGRGGRHGGEFVLPVCTTRGRRAAARWWRKSRSMQIHRAIKAATKLPVFIAESEYHRHRQARAGGGSGRGRHRDHQSLLGGINPETRKPILSNIVGGLSGPAIRYLAVKMVWDCAKVLKIPLSAWAASATRATRCIHSGRRHGGRGGSYSFRQPDAAQGGGGARRLLRKARRGQYYRAIGEMIV